MNTVWTNRGIRVVGGTTEVLGEILRSFVTAQPVTAVFREKGGQFYDIGFGDLTRAEMLQQGHGGIAEHIEGCFFPVVGELQEDQIQRSLFLSSQRAGQLEPKSSHSRQDVLLNFGRRGGLYWPETQSIGNDPCVDLLEGRAD